jgi:Transposase, Mutator family
VQGTVEETLNALLDAEADRLCNAQCYDRSAARRDTRAGHYERKLQRGTAEGPEASGPRHTIFAEFVNLFAGRYTYVSL